MSRDSRTETLARAVRLARPLTIPQQPAKRHSQAVIGTMFRTNRTGHARSVPPVHHLSSPFLWLAGIVVSFAPSLALADLQWQAASPTGGEAFSMKGGVTASASYLAGKIFHCVALPDPFLPIGLVPPANVSPASKIGWRATICDPNPGNPADPQIAVSSTRVVVTFENSMAWYDKKGVDQGHLTNFDLF